MLERGVLSSRTKELQVPRNASDVNVDVTAPLFYNHTSSIRVL